MARSVVVGHYVVLLVSITALLVAANDEQLEPDREGDTWGNLEAVHGKGTWSNYLSGSMNLHEVENAGAATTACDRARQAEQPICELHGSHSKVCKVLREQNDHSCRLGDARDMGEGGEPKQTAAEDSGLAKIKFALHRADRRHAGVHAAMKAYSSLDSDVMNDAETKFALQATGLPTVDPFLSATEELGEGITDDHLDNMMNNAMRVFKAVSDIDEAVKRVKQPSDGDALRADIQTQLTDPMNRFLMATSKLHPKMVHVDHSVALGESVSLFRRRKRANASVANGGVCKKNKECTSGKCAGNGAGFKEGKCQGVIKQENGAGCRKNSECTSGMCNGNGGGVKKGKCKTKQSMMKKMVGKVKAFFDKTGLSKVFGYIASMAKKFLKKVVDLLKKAVKWVAKHLFTLMPSSFINFIDRLQKCSETGGELRKQKCSYGELTKDGKASCKNGGGSGMNWLWSERINTRKGPTTWMSVVPDSSECHNQTNPAEAGKAPKACRKASDFCMNRYDDFGGQLDAESQKFWQNWNYTVAKAKCEGRTSQKPNGDNRCLFMDMYLDGMMTQSGLKCVPKLNKKDPRYEPEANYAMAKKSKFEVVVEQERKKTAELRAKKGLKPKIQKYKKDQIDRAQLIVPKWQMAVKPYLGGAGGLQTSAGLFEKQWAAFRQLKKAYVRTGDFCINYRPDKDGKIPATRARCTSQQFMWNTDLSNPLICADMRPSVIGNMIVKWVVMPIFKILPGNLDQFLGPAVTGFVSSAAGERLDDILASMLPFGFSFIYVMLSKYIYEWTGFDCRNVLTQHEADAIVTKRMGMNDWSIDSTLDRMQKVFKDKACPRVDDKTDAKAKLYAADTGCPAAIPVRAMQTSASRAGDVADGAFTSLWPGRTWVRIGTQRLRISYIKQSTCLKLPICDTKLFMSRGGGSVYGGYDGKTNTDCSMHGQCQWNKKLGNHCHCDTGYWYLRKDQQCCKGAKKGENKAECVAEWKRRVSGSVGSYSSKSTSKKSKAAAQGKNKKDESSRVKELEEKVKQKDAELTKKGRGSAQAPQEQRHVKRSVQAESVKVAAALSHAGYSLLKEQQGGEEAGEVTHRQAVRVADALSSAGFVLIKQDTRPKAHEGEAQVLLEEMEGGPPEEEEKLQTVNAAKAKASHNFIRKWGNRIALKKKVVVEGADINSEWCANAEKSNNCERQGCMLAGGKCVDASSWHCAAQKKILDCVTTPFLSPWAVPAYLDEMCGKMVFGQKTGPMIKRCNDGVRHGETCSSNQDCPANPIHDVKFPPIPSKYKHAKGGTGPNYMFPVETGMGSTGGFYLKQSGMVVKGKTDRTCVDKSRQYPNCGFNKCGTFSGVQGCNDFLQNSCKEMGYENFAAMAV